MLAFVRMASGLCVSIWHSEYLYAGSGVLINVLVHFEESYFSSLSF